MTNIPNFVSQVQEVEQKLNTEWLSVQKGWQDNVADSFREEIMKPYLQKFQQYIVGEAFNGYGLEGLLRQMDNHLQDMDAILKE
jgi:hypothetical protein